MPADAPTAPPDPSRWTPVRLLLRTEHLRLLRRWAVEEDRPVELHMARLLRLAALEHAQQREPADAR